MDQSIIERFRKAANGSDGRAQLMAHIGHILPARLLQPLRLGDVPKQNNDAGLAAAAGLGAGAGYMNDAICGRELHFDRLCGRGGLNKVIMEAFCKRLTGKRIPAILHQPLCGRVGKDHGFQIGIERDHAISNPFQNGREAVARENKVAYGGRQCTRQVVERTAQLADLARIRLVGTRTEVAVSHLGGHLRHLLDRRCDAAASEIGGQKHDECRNTSAHRHRPKQLPDRFAHLSRTLCQHNGAVDPVQIVVYRNADGDQPPVPDDIRDLIAGQQHIGHDLLIRRTRFTARILLRPQQQRALRVIDIDAGTPEFG